MDEQLSSKSTWNTIASASDELAGVRPHRALGKHACACGKESPDPDDLTARLASEAPAASETSA